MPVLISEGVSAGLLSHVAVSADMHVMDFGAGTGLICTRLAPLVDRIYAVDISAAMLNKLASKPELQGKVEIVCQDILQTPLGKPVDLIVSAMALHHVEDTNALLEKFSEHLEPGGVIALADLDTEDGTFHPEDIEGVFHHGFDRERLCVQLRDNGFEDIQFVTALELPKDDKTFPIFLVTAKKAQGSKAPS